MNIYNFRSRNLLLLIFVILVAVSCKPTHVLVDDPKVVTDPAGDEWVSTYSYAGMDQKTIYAHIAVERFLHEMSTGSVTGRPELGPQVRIDSVRIEPGTELDAATRINVYFNPSFADYPIRPWTVEAAETIIRGYLSEDLYGSELRFYSMGYDIVDLIPVYHLRGKDDRSRMVIPDPAVVRRSGSTASSPSFETMATGAAGEPVVSYLRYPESDPVSGFQWIRNMDQPWVAPLGLENRHIAMWHSHGWYYNNTLGRWEWQRPRLFGTVEDLLPMQFVIPYIIPMLENAGAYVWIPRERDVQHNEVVVDNDLHLHPFTETVLPETGSVYTELSTSADRGWKSGAGKGFHPPGSALRGNENPFTSGTYRVSPTDTTSSNVARWIPYIPETGEYAVYISYVSTDSSIADAHYRVYHSGGQTNFLVNQKIGGGTWIYLGHFRFQKGRDAMRGAVELMNISRQNDGVVTADAVRFGGGMGIVERGGRTSGRPRFVEGARYHLQYSGVPDTLVWRLNENNDYNDDFQSRGEWVNYLRGYPYGPNRDRTAGLGIPVEVSLAFHTDAGVTRDDRTIGTLAIYSVPDMQFDMGFPDGVTRLENRDLTDLMQSQIVDDIRALYDSNWNRRRLMNSRYSEAARPNVPSVLLELLSHQNFRDMEFGMDPQFRFDVSRSIYKSIVRFIAARHGIDYQIQPLPITDLASKLVGNSVHLSWSGVSDPLEPTAEPDRYIVYTRVGDGGFDNGISVSENHMVISGLQPGQVYSFKVRAANDGGISMPSEVVSVGLANERPIASKTVLIVNGFTRISAPAVVKAGDFRGFASFLDAGVPDRYDIGYVGDQVNFNVFDDWVDNDNPGHGMSHGYLETTIIPGNTFDFASVHGSSLIRAGYSFFTVSEADVESGKISGLDHKFVHVILGNQRQIRNQTHFADSTRGYRFGIYGPGMRKLLSEVAANRGGILVSGAHTGTDLVHRPQPDSTVIAFARDVLKYEYRVNHASRLGEVFSVARPNQPSGTQSVSNLNLRFNTGFHPTIYRVDAPDAIRPVGDRSTVWLRYRENEFSAGIRYDGPYRTVVLGFPIETILESTDRDLLIREAMRFLDR